MPIGIIVNVFAVFLGGILGTVAGHLMSDEFKEKITMIFGLCAMTMGISALCLMENLPAVIFAAIIGTTIGAVICLGSFIERSAGGMQGLVSSVLSNDRTDMTKKEFNAQLVTIIVLFCASGSGIYGSLDSGMTGDHTILICKSMLDLFTAAIFACNLGYVVSLIAIPQFVIFILLFLGAKTIFPLTTPDMIADFKACGGILIIASGFRIIKVGMFPIADMIPAMIIVMPFSGVWTKYIVPLLAC